MKTTYRKNQYSDLHYNYILRVVNVYFYLRSRQDELVSRDKNYLDYVDTEFYWVLQSAKAASDTYDELLMIVGDTFGHETMYWLQHQPIKEADV